jgi:hypothetical protein
MPGACTQDGIPCTAGSTCCSRLCVPPYSGAKVSICQPAAGCRMTGDYCDRTQECCGGSPDALHPVNNPYGVYCDTAGKHPAPPANDPSSKDDYRCTNGTSCNPPGNICGGSGAVNASQNCCDGKKAVCKQDSNGIYRCFGGCPNDDCTRCPTGYDANDPACCIPAVDPTSVTTANVCQFSDQCCGGNPCVPDPVTGVLHCVRPTGPTCTPSGGSCLGPDDLSCCAPNTCLETSKGSNVWKCGTQSSSCTAAGGTCATDATCCSELCRDGGTGLKCVSCVPNGLACLAGAQCCSGNCKEGTCAAACLGSGATCTLPTDCCTGLTCNVPSGATSGTCGTVQTCSALTQPCNDAMPCCAGSCYVDPAHGNYALCSGLVSGCSCGE